MLRSYSNISLSDAELLEKYQQTLHANYIGDLLKRYNRLVFSVCFKYLKNEDDSKDAVMQIFEKLLEILKDQKVSYFKSWLYMVAKNHCLMQLRKQKTQLKHQDGIIEFQQSLMENGQGLHHTDEG